MNKNPNILNALVTEFINTKDTKMRFSNFYDLLKEGNIRDFCFVYKKSKNSKTRYKSSKIYKLDLYNREIITIDQRVYKILNEGQLALKNK